MMLAATERWTNERLVALAGALALPCPVREGFLFDPDHAFRQQCTESDTTLQRAIKRVFDHAGIACEAAVVLRKAGPTRVERDGDTWFFELAPAAGDPEITARTVGGVLARQAGRALLARRGITSGDIAKADAELVAMLAGLGGLILADPTRGALHPRLHRYAYARTCASLGVGISRAIDVVPERAPLAVLWARVSRARIPFQPVEPNVIIRCFCATRLRVPSGKQGTTTCPACKRKRPFDGRACRIQSISMPRTLLPATRPTLAAWQKPLVYLAELPLAARTLVALIAMFVTITFIARW